METVKELIVNAYGCTAPLSDAKTLETVSRKAVESVGATVADSVAYPFQPHGLTLCLILMESHLVLSTWPEHELAVINIFLCNSSMNPRDSWKVMEAHLKPSHVRFHEVSHRIGPLSVAAA